MSSSVITIAAARFFCDRNVSAICADAERVAEIVRALSALARGDAAATTGWAAAERAGPGLPFAGTPPRRPGAETTFPIGGGGAIGLAAPSIGFGALSEVELSPRMISLMMRTRSSSMGDSAVASSNGSKLE